MCIHLKGVTKSLYGSVNRQKSNTCICMQTQNILTFYIEWVNNGYMFFLHFLQRHFGFVEDK